VTRPILIATVLLLIPAAVSVLPGVQADTVELTNGNVLVGEITEESEEGIFLEVEGGRIFISHSQIRALHLDNPVRTALRRGRALRQKGRLREAEAALRQGLGQSPGSRALLKELAGTLAAWVRVRLAGGFLDHAAEILDRMPQSSGFAKERERLSGLLARRRGELDAARAGLAELKAKGNFSRARGVLLAALRAHPAGLRRHFRNLGDLHLRWGRGLAKQKLWDEAASRLWQAVSWNPHLARPVQGELVEAVLRDAHSRLLPAGRWPEAREAIRRAFDFYPGNRALGIAASAIIAERKGRGAEGLWQKALGLLSVPEAAPRTGDEEEDDRQILPGLVLTAPKDAAPRLVRVCGHHLRRTAERFGLGEEVLSRVRVSVEVLPRRPGGAEALPAWAGGETRVTMGEGGETKALIRAARDHPQLTTGVLPHEFGHLAFHVFAGAEADLPVWIHEGAALWSETRARQEHVSKMLGTHLGVETRIPLGEFLAMKGYPPGPADRRTMDLFYAWSFGFFHFLCEREGLAGIREFIGLLGSLPVETALASVWKFQSIPAMAREWASWARRRFPAPWEAESE
jgi:tetratricopeptide (TPR) repeat protein